MSRSAFPSAGLEALRALSHAQAMQAPMEAAAAKAAKTTETKNRPKDRKQTQKKTVDDAESSTSGNVFIVDASNC